MNCSVYIFGKLSSGYTQYPEDSSSDVLRTLYNHCKAPTQIVIHRDGSMMFYCYIRKLDGGKYIGLGIAINGYYISNADKLFPIFENTIEKMACQGVFIHFAADGSLTTSLKNLKAEEEEIDTLAENLRLGIERKSNAHQKLPHTDYTIAKDSVKEFCISDNSLDIIRASYTYGFTYIYKKKDYDTVRMNCYRSVLSKVIKENATLKKDNANLREEKQKILNQKKQYRKVVILSLIVIICLLGLFLFYNEVTNKSRHISKLERTIFDKNLAVNKRDSAIVGLEDSLKELHSDVERITSFTSATGATIRNSDSHDNGWIMWLKAKQKVKIESFYVKGNTSGNVTIGLYDANDNLIASTNAKLSGEVFTKIDVGPDWIIDRKECYMKIRSGVSLQYHNSNDKEYNQFLGGALIVTGSCSYDDRRKGGAKTRHAYYQYFYNIQYRILN